MNDSEERFTNLYDRHYRAVLEYALLRADHSVAEDVCSETFLVAWRRLAELPEPVLPWLLGVARNLLAKQRDSRGRRGCSTRTYNVRLHRARKRLARALRAESSRSTSQARTAAGRQRFAEET